eukprot:7017896-Ditylum_brightwellii.AAC.1
MANQRITWRHWLPSYTTYRVGLLAQVRTALLEAAHEYASSLKIKKCTYACVEPRLMVALLRQNCQINPCAMGRVPTAHQKEKTN